MIAVEVHNAAFGRKKGISDPRQYVTFAWEKEQTPKKTAREVEREVMAFRNVVRNKWGLKYEHEK